MRLSAALVPPEAVREDLATVVRSVRAKPSEIRLLPAHSLYVWVANFGNVSHTDAQKLKAALATRVSELQPPHLWVAGGTALDSERDDSVWADLQGDVDTVDELVRLMPQIVRRLGFPVDRRGIRSKIRLGRITGDTTVEYLQRVLDHLATYEGPSWTCRELTLMRPRADADASSERRYEPMHHLPLATADTSSGRTPR